MSTKSKKPYWLEDWNFRAKRPSILWGFLNGNIVTIEASTLNGVLAIHKKSGEVMTCYGFFPTSSYYGVRWYRDEPTLLRSLHFNI